jgi:hypothetical protein
MSKEHYQVCHLVTYFLKDSNLSTKTLIAKALSDNTDLFRNFADKIQAIPLQDEVYGHDSVEKLF